MRFLKQSNIVEDIQTWLATEGLTFAINLAVFIAILIVGRIIIGMAKKMLRSVIQKSGKLEQTLENFLVDVSGRVLWIVVFMIGLGQLGIDIGPLIAALGVAGFVIGFALQESLGNLAAGVMLLLNNPFTIGHFVEAGGHSGTVRELNLMSTVMTTGDNKRITIPNSSIWGNAIVNYSANDTRRVDMVVGIGYGDDIGAAMKIIQEIVDQHPKILKDPATNIAVTELADSSVNMVVRPWVNTPDYWSVYFDFHRQVKEKLDAAEIELPFPQMDVHHHGLPQQS